MEKPKVKRVEVSREKVRDGKGKEKVRHVVRAHFHDRKPMEGKGMKGAMASPYVPPEKTVHETADGAKAHVGDLMGRMAPGDDSY